MKKGIINAFNFLSTADSIDLALKISLVLFLFSEWVGGEDWQYKTPIIAQSGLALVLPGLHKHKIIWVLLALIFIIKTIDNWWVQDNHLFVNTYWAVTVAFALSFKEVPKVLAENARIMLGLVFLFATIWKFLSPDFISSAYFHYTFLTDVRFMEETKIVAGLSRADIVSNISAMSKIASESEAVSNTLQSNASIAMAAKFVTWHTIMIESLLAILFLIPLRFKLSRYRNYLLILFALTTYLAMPIHSFAWLLIAVCISQTRKHEKIDRALLIVCLPVMLAYKYVPFMQWIADSI